MAFYINDSIFGSIFFFLTGLHFFHVVVGIILISIILGIVSIVSLPPASPNQATLHRLCDAGRRGSETKRTFRCSPLGGNLRILPFHLYYNLQLIYWHFIEMPSYPYEPGCESLSDSLLTPGMDNTRHFYSITAVAGIVWTQTIPRSNSGTSIRTYSSSATLVPMFQPERDLTAAGTLTVLR